MYDGSTKWYSKTYILTTIIRTTPQIHFVMSSSWFWSCNRLINTGSINFIINTHISRRCCHCGGGKVLYHVHLTSVKSFDKPQPYLITVNRLIWYLTLRHYPKTFSDCSFYCLWHTLCRRKSIQAHISLSKFRPLAWKCSYFFI